MTCLPHRPQSTSPGKLDDAYLRYGLNALCRAYKFNYFRDGHRGGAIISGVYLCRENATENGVDEIIASCIDKHLITEELCADFPAAVPDANLLGHIFDCMVEHMSGLREAGHNIILPTLALKAFRDLPEAITPQRVNGILRLISSFTVTDVLSDEPVDLPNMADSAQAANFILEEFLANVERFRGRGQGWSGHLLTLGKALLDLHELGYVDLAKEAEQGYKTYIRRIRLGPQEGDKDHPEHIPTGHFPIQKAYWQERVGDLTFGHQLKYPYGFYGLLRCASNDEIKRRSLEVAYRIF